MMETEVWGGDDGNGRKKASELHIRQLNFAPNNPMKKSLISLGAEGKIKAQNVQSLPKPGPQFCQTLCTPDLIHCPQADSNCHF